MESTDSSLYSLCLKNHFNINNWENDLNSSNDSNSSSDSDGNCSIDEEYLRHLPLPTLVSLTQKTGNEETSIFSSDNNIKINEFNEGAKSVGLKANKKLTNEEIISLYDCNKTDQFKKSDFTNNLNQLDQTKIKKCIDSTDLKPTSEVSVSKPFFFNYNEESGTFQIKKYNDIDNSNLYKNYAFIGRKNAIDLNKNKDTETNESENSELKAKDNFAEINLDTLDKYRIDDYSDFIRTKLNRNCTNSTKTYLDNHNKYDQYLKENTEDHFNDPNQLHQTKIINQGDDLDRCAIKNCFVLNEDKNFKIKESETYIDVINHFAKDRIENLVKNDSDELNNNKMADAMNYIDSSQQNKVSYFNTDKNLILHTTSAYMRSNLQRVTKENMDTSKYLSTQKLQHPKLPSVPTTTKKCQKIDPIELFMQKNKDEFLFKPLKTPHQLDNNQKIKYKLLKPIPVSTSLTSFNLGPTNLVSEERNEENIPDTEYFDLIEDFDDTLEYHDIIDDSIDKNLNRDILISNFVMNAILKYLIKVYLYFKTIIKTEEHIK